jgi:hypothetical protein
MSLPHAERRFALDLAPRDAQELHEKVHETSTGLQGHLANPPEAGQTEAEVDSEEFQITVQMTTWRCFSARTAVSRWRATNTFQERWKAKSSQI